VNRGLFITLLAMLTLAAVPYSTAQDKSPDEPAISEEIVEVRAREVGRALRCVVCQNQSIEDSNASLAEDMRTLVRARIRQGDSNEDVLDYMQSRYGDFVLLEPPVQPNTYVLWAFPFALLLFGLFWFRRLNKRQKITSTKTTE